MHNLTRLSIRYLLRHPWQFGLSVLGIAVGVAVVVSVDIAGRSSERAFLLSLDAVAGKATHHIVGPAEGIPDSVYVNLRVHDAVRPLAPVIEARVVLQTEGRPVFTLLGVDPFAERDFRDYLGQTASSFDGQLVPFLTRPGAVVLSDESAALLGIAMGDSLRGRIDGRDVHMYVVGTIAASGETRQALHHLLLADLATAQELTERPGRIDRIDAIFANDDQQRHAVSLLPAGYEVLRSSSRSETAQQMLEAFSINLTALSLLALVVGVFLIFNTMTFSVVQRRGMIGTLRSLGMTAREILIMIMREACLVGLTGTILGFALAVLMTDALLKAVSQTISDLYFVVSVRSITIGPMTFLKGAGLGVFATIVAAARPAWEASRVVPRIASVRSFEESDLRRNVPLMAGAGAASLMFGGAVLFLPSTDLWVSYLGILPVIAGFSLLTPAAMLAMERVASPIFRRIAGLRGTMASRSIVRNMSRTHVAIGALALAVASTVGIGTMISTFRSTVVEWLDARLRADLFVSAPGTVARRNDGVLPMEILDRIRRTEGVRDVEYFRDLDLIADKGSVHLIAAGLGGTSRDGFRFTSGDPADIWAAFDSGDVLITEPFAFRNGLSEGSVLTLRTDSGERNFRVAAVNYDYASDQGIVTVRYDVFRRLWNVDGLSGIGVYAAPGISVEELGKEIASLATPDLDLLVRTNKALLDTSIDIFDRTFAVARVLQILSVVVAFIGILSALMSLQLERRRELGVLRAAGMLPREVSSIVHLQTLLMGCIAGILALPLGNILAAILVFIINKRSFGWTMQFDLQPGLMAEALVLSVVAAFIAGIYPGHLMSRSSPAAALRNE